jgi:hypothetical protein
MILVYAIVTLIILALIFRRDLSTLGNFHYRGGWTFALAVMGLFILQAALVIFVPGQTAGQMTLLIISQLALVFFLLLNHHIPGAKLFALGIFLNTFVMVANGGWMPITPELYEWVHPNRISEVFTKPPSSKNMILPYQDTTLWVLSDIIPVSLPWRRNAVSMGDILLVVGAAQFIFMGTKKRQVNETIEIKNSSSPSERGIST